MNRTSKIAIVVALALVVGALIVVKNKGCLCGGPQQGTEAPTSSTPEAPQPVESLGLPRLVDLGSTSCVPCKMMAPILEELKEEYAGRLRVEFIDTNQDKNAAAEYRIRVIPTQVFIDASGKELFRHEGFMAKEDILAKWKTLGVDLKGEQPSAFQRMDPAKPDTRPRDAVCYMCDGDINPKTLAVVKTDKGDVRLCGPHCYFILYTSLTENKVGFEDKVRMTDYATGNSIPATEAVYLRGMDSRSGRPWVKAFAGDASAKAERRASGGGLTSFGVLQQHELSARCGFCDRACYPQDVARVIAGGLHTYGCCSHCALGIAARTGLDIEVRQPDRLTGEMVVVKTRDGSIASIEPPTAVAWFGMRKKADGKWGSAGCFHQGFFRNETNLRKWVEANPHETGKQITIHRALADKMKLTPKQIMKACKIGECAPK